jgi:enoyl-CoA hydratase
VIRAERDSGVATVVVDRPDAMNALDVATLTELREQLQELRDDGDVRVIVLTGAGERAFIAGADVKYMSGLAVKGAKEWGALGHEVASLLETMPKPTIAAINGFALGGGCELALACDIRYASRRRSSASRRSTSGSSPAGEGRSDSLGCADSVSRRC